MKRRPLLTAAAIICVLVAVRVAVTGKIGYGFLPWNMLLASVPLLLEPLFYRVKEKLQGIVRRLCQVALAALWVLFLPNACYVLTDFLHLNSTVLVNAREDSYGYVTQYTRGDGLYIYDSLLLFFATAFSIYVGALATLHAYAYLRHRLSKVQTASLVSLLFVLSGIGVYIGRFSRWNSWDAVGKPFSVMADLMHDLQIDYRRDRLIQVVCTMVLFQVLAFMYVKNLQLMADTRRKRSEMR